ncbi:SDR family NAD(P)-dependent oxidoreductase [Telmatospirillum siberiense]|uniref:3-oxoacyl-ACP reductase n=1 Tax=Telmatospirillum siberiense TaxID=382514 RepID=A0A2N3Q0J3_9PROT|nr:SDR family oxidoreductase [Telmatospirillum siberiense]PKU26179.1 3-oxoacyl-ACP reductase [Telmatospirillum siberiense]
MTKDSATTVFRLDGEVALITGGGSGLGLAMAHCLAKAGAKVVIVGRREAVLRDACIEIGPAASYEVADITDFPSVEALVGRIAKQVGPISILINNAGIHLKKAAVDTTVEAFGALMNTHVLAAHNLTRHVLPAMIEAKHGSILFTASMTSIIGMPLVIAYSAAKSAYLGMVRGLSAEVAEHNVRVNAIAPGWIESPMLRKALDGDEKRSNKILSRTPMGRFGEPDDIGWAAVYLCSPAARFVTGVLLPVDGGASQGF